MQTRLQLAHVFPNQTMIDVLVFFFFHPVEKVQLAHIVQATNKALIQVQRTLKRLIDIGLVLKGSKTGKTYYQANPSHIAYEDLQHLALKAKILSSDRENELLKLTKKFEYGFIYGSVAHGTNTEMSDIDVFLVGNSSFNHLGSFFFDLGRELMREVNPIIFSEKQIKAEIKEQNSFIKGVLKGPKIWLFGNKNEFENVSKKWLSQAS